MTFVELFNKVDQSEAEKNAFDVLITDLIVDNKFGPEKSKELTAQNMEQKMVTNFVPTMFYIFMYVRQKPEKLGDIDFYDMCPIILCTGVNEEYVTGINFNLIPNNVRAVFLDVITKEYKEFYDLMNITVPDEMILNNSLGSILTSEHGLSRFMKYMKSKTGVDLSACIRKYFRSNIVKSRMIEYDQWHYIPFISFRDSVRGANLAELQTEVVIENLDK